LRDNKVKLVCDEIDAALIVMAGRIRLEQVLVNLLQNAFEALEGEVNPLVNICVSTDANHITLSIIDNGPGISPEVFQKLFTPFITTKLHGLGLGLVIAHDIVRDFGGELRAETSTAEVLTEQIEITKTSITNTTKKGTSFHIKLRRVNHE
jgi:two-component system C4-dicarboxylate transport sensor histidine kinase DctB